MIVLHFRWFMIGLQSQSACATMRFNLISYCQSVWYVCVCVWLPIIICPTRQFWKGVSIHIENWQTKNHHLYKRYVIAFVMHQSTMENLMTAALAILYIMIIMYGYFIPINACAHPVHKDAFLRMGAAVEEIERNSFSHHSHWMTNKSHRRRQEASNLFWKLFC